jgi:hypothetical protein
VDFKQACKFYVANYKRLKNPTEARNLVANSYHLLQYKRKKLRTGSTTFVFKQLFYGDWLIYQWFDMEFSTQTSLNESQKGVERTLGLLDWSWDFKNIILLGVITATGFNYFTAQIEDYYNTLIAGGFEESVIRVGLDETFKMIEVRSFSSHTVSMHSLTDSVVNLAMVFDLF